jgi:hypothetical protein
VPVFAWRNAESGAKGTSEGRVVREPPLCGDVVDPHGTQGRVGEVAAGPFQALPADPGGDGDAVGLEQAVQMADRDVMRGRDGARGEVRVVQVREDVGLDSRGQCPLTGMLSDHGFLFGSDGSGSVRDAGRTRGGSM